MASAKSDLATAQWNLDQSKDLFKAGAIAERDLKVAEQAVESAKARLAAAEARLKSSSNGARDTRVLAPAAGVIEKRLVQTGERVTRGPAAVQPRAQRRARARRRRSGEAGDAPSSRARPCTSSPTARNFDGRVARVSPTIDPTTRAITVYVQVPNRDGALKGGTFATGRVVQRTLDGRARRSDAALRQSQENGQTFVYRIAESRGRRRARAARRRSTSAPARRRSCRASTTATASSSATSARSAAACRSPCLAPTTRAVRAAVARWRWRRRSRPAAATQVAAAAAAKKNPTP